MKPWFEEGDIIEVVEAGVRYFYIVEKVEDLVYDYREYGTVESGKLGNFKQIEDLQPKAPTDPESRIYQVRAGIDVGMAYVELLAGTARRGTDEVPKPTKTKPYVGYFNEESSPFENPTFQFYLFPGEKPAFAVYNKFGFTITPYLSFRGEKLKVFDMEKKKTKDILRIEDLEEILKKVKKNVWPHRHITKYGIEEA